MGTKKQDTKMICGP